MDFGEGTTSAIRHFSGEAMKNLSFVIWMLGYPLVLALGEKWNPIPLDATVSERGTAALVVFIIWFVVGRMLYEGKPKEKP